MAVVAYKDTVKRILNTPQKKTYTFMGATLVLILILLFGAIRPTITTITRLNSEIRQRETLNAEMQSKLNTIQGLQKDYNRIEEDIIKLNYYFPHDADYSLLMANIENIVKSYGFDLERIQIEATREDSAVPSNFQYMNKVDARINIIGRQEDIVPLLRHLEGLPVILEVSRIAFAPEDQEGINQVKVSLSLEMYKMSRTIGEL